MPDIVEPHVRSRMMGGIRGRDTRPELSLRRALHARGFRYRIHVRALPGTPDLVLPRHRAAIFVNGCFWHRHEGCHYCSTPSTRAEFWTAKFTATIARDSRALSALQADGWRTAVVWECGLAADTADETVDGLVAWLTSASQAIVLPPRPPRLRAVPAASAG